MFFWKDAGECTKNRFAFADFATYLLRHSGLWFDLHLPIFDYFSPWFELAIPFRSDTSRLWISALPTAFNGLRVAWKSARPWNCGTLEPATAQCRSWNLQAEGWLLGWMVGKCWSAIVEKWWMWKIITTDSPTTAPLFGSLLWTADWFKYRAPKRWQNRSTLAPTMLSKCQFYLRLWACARSGLESRRRMANRFSLFQKNM